MSYKSYNTNLNFTLFYSYYTLRARHNLSISKRIGLPMIVREIAGTANGGEDDEENHENIV